MRRVSLILICYSSTTWCIAIIFPLHSTRGEGTLRQPVWLFRILVCIFGVSCLSRCVKSHPKLFILYEKKVSRNYSHITQTHPSSAFIEAEYPVFSSLRLLGALATLRE